MIERDFITRTEWKKHLKADWRRVHNLWPHLKNYVPGWGYSKAETDAFFEGYDGGKAQVDWARITSKPGTFPPSAHTLASHSTKAHAELSDAPANAHHAQTHALTTHSDFTTYLNQAVKTTSSVIFDYVKATGGATDVIFGDDFAGVNRLFTDATDNLEYKNSANNYGAMKLSSLVLGSFYLNSLIANNKVPDSDKLDGLHSTDFLVSPMTAALDMGGFYIGNTDYIRTVGGATNLILGKDIAGVNRLFTDASNNLEYKNSANNYGAMKLSSLVIGAFYLNSLIANNKVPDSDKLDGLHSTDFVANPLTAALACGGYSVFNAEYYRASGGETDLMVGDELAGVNRLFTDATNNLIYKSAGDVFGALKVGSLVIGSFYLNSLIANNKVPDSDKLDGSHASAFATAAHTHVKVDITDTPWAWTDVSKTGSNLTDLVTRQHAGLTNITSGQHHPQLHASAHHVAGGDLVNHDSLTGFVAAEHKSLPNTIAQVLSDHTLAVHNALAIDHGSLGGKADDDHSQYYNSTRHTKAIHDALNIDADTLDGINSGGFLQNPATVALDMGEFYIGNCDYFRAVGGTTNLALGKDVAGVNRLITDASNNLEYYTSANVLGAIKASSFVLGSYYLNSLIAHNKVPDSDKVDGEHASAIVTDARVKAHFPDTIANILSNHTLAVHNALAIDHGSLGGKGDDDHSQYYNAARHTVAIHDALNINADRLDGVHAGSFLQNPATAALAMGGYAVLNAEYFRASGGASNLMVGDEIAGVNRLFTDASNNLAYKSAADTYGSFIVASVKIGSYYINSLIANNKVPDSDKLDNYHHTSFMKIAGGTFTGYAYARDHGTAATDMIVNVCYGTGSPPAANTTTIGSLFIKYTA